MTVHLISVPYDSGRRGERMGAGPGVLARALEPRIQDAGHVVHHVTIEAPADSWRAEIRTAFDLARQVAQAVRDANLALTESTAPRNVKTMTSEVSPL